MSKRSMPPPTGACAKPRRSAVDIITRPVTVIRDTTPPTLTVQTPEVASLHFQVTWSGEDGESELRDYDVAYKVGAGGAWTGWLTGTNQTKASFVGQSSQTHYFLIQAMDNACTEPVEVSAIPATGWRAAR